MAKSASVISRVIGWLNAGYPDGIPPTDRFPVIAVLKRRLTDEEVLEICAQLTGDESRDELRTSTAGRISRTEVQDLIRRVLLEEPSEADLRRVSSRLAAGGWPLAGSGSSTVDDNSETARA